MADDSARRLSIWETPISASDMPGRTAQVRFRSHQFRRMAYSSRRGTDWQTDDASGRPNRPLRADRALVSVAVTTEASRAASASPFAVPYGSSNPLIPAHRPLARGRVTALCRKASISLVAAGSTTQRRVVVLSVNIADSDCRDIHFEVKDPRGRDLERQTLCCEEQIPVRKNDIERVPFKLSLHRV